MLGLSGFAAAQGAAFSQALRPGSAVDDTVCALTAQPTFVDDGTRLPRGNIVSYNMQGYDNTSLRFNAIIS